VITNLPPLLSLMSRSLHLTQFQTRILGSGWLDPGRLRGYPLAHLAGTWW
jgi:hypothetical protein